MPRRFNLAAVLMAVVLLLGILPLRPLVSALAVRESGGQHCALHGADCQCKQHCNREQRQAHHNQPPATGVSPATAVSNEAPAPQASACHRASPSETAEGAAKSAPSSTENGASPGGCVMTSCGDEAPMLLSAQGQPYLAALLVSAPHRLPDFDAAPSTRTLFHSSLAVPPPVPPPKS